VATHQEEGGRKWSRSAACKLDSANEGREKIKSPRGERKGRKEKGRRSRVEVCAGFDDRKRNSESGRDTNATLLRSAQEKEAVSTPS